MQATVDGRIAQPHRLCSGDEHPPSTRPAPPCRLCGGMFCAPGETPDPRRHCCCPGSQAYQRFASTCSQDEYGELAALRERWQRAERERNRGTRFARLYAQAIRLRWEGEEIEFTHPSLWRAFVVNRWTERGAPR